MAQLELNSLPRSPIGSNHTRRLRRQGLIPAVLYGGGEEAIAIALPRSEFGKGTFHLYENQILNLRVGTGPDTKSQAAIVAEIQIDHLSGRVLHIDFRRISLSEKLTATVTIEAVGEAIGVTRDGGILAHLLREVEIRSLPGDLPETIQIDVSQLEIGDTLLAGDLPLGEGVEILTDPEIGIITVTAPISEEDELEEVDIGEAEEGPGEEAEE